MNPEPRQQPLALNSGFLQAYFQTLDVDIYESAALFHLFLGRS